MRVLMSPITSGQNTYVDELVRHLGREAVVEPFDRRAVLGRPDVIHVHWPEFLVRWTSARQAAGDSAKVLLLLGVARARGAALVWTGHNLEPHGRSHGWVQRMFISRFVGQVDLLVSLSESGAEQLRRRYPSLRAVPFRVVPHGDYRHELVPVGRSEAKERYGRADQPTLLCFGQVRAYKNIQGLIEAFRATSHPAVRLVVAGEPREPGLEERLRAASGGDPQVDLLLERISGDELSPLLASADVTVAAYKEGSALNSGVALLSLSADRPCVLRDTPSNRELQSLAGERWVYLCDGSAEDAVRTALVAVADERTERPNLDAFAWERVAAQTGDAYAAAVASAREGCAGRFVPRRRRPYDQS